MNKLLFLLLLPILCISQNTAPSDYIVNSVKLEEGKNSFLYLNLNVVSSIDQAGWDIALYNDVHEIGGKVNETKGVKVWRVFRDTIQFSGVTLSDTLDPFFNNDSFAYLGALDTIYTGSANAFFRIGIGKFYLDAGYSAVANRVYIIRKEDGSFGKFYINYSNRVFTIHYSNIDNSGDKYISVTKNVSPFLNQYQFLNLTTGATSTSFEPEMKQYDLVFRKYQKGGIVHPMGILSNNAYNLVRFSGVEGFPQDYLKYAVVSTEIYQASGSPSSVTYNGSLNTMEPISRLNNQIAEKWYNATTNQPVQNISYFLRDKNGKLWHLIFTTYDAATNTLNIAFKDKGTVASIQNNDNLKSTVYQIENKLIINRDDEKKTNLTIVDLTGKLVYKSVFIGREEIDISNLRHSVFFLKFESDKKTSTLKIGTN